MTSTNAKPASANQAFLLKRLVIGATLSSFLAACASVEPAQKAASSTLADPNEPVIALVLGGGGAKGLAHVGVIKSLAAHDIHPNLIVGTSVGSLVGSIYASGQSADQLESLAVSFNDSDITDFTVSYQGIIEGAKLRNFVNTHVNNQRIEAFPTRFAAVAAEKHSQQKAVFTEGEAGLVVQASSSVPNVFIAPRIPDPKTSGIVGKKYVDGGVVSIVPVDTAKALGADVVIAVDLQVGTGSSDSRSSTGFNPLMGQAKKSIWSLIEQGYNNYANKQSSTATRSYQAANQAEISRADIVIRPQVADISPINTIDREQAIAAGVQATEQNLPAIQAAIEQATVNHRQRLSTSH
ncbi:patatin-like phospholipase family protein [Psychrobacter sp. FDAARGOS_221]|uniref:patatin-like phospholipase family protein n=1 Tax=Psychrobacter sp. FDAARGOS_221 TaxID=1975705 RepID=UPI000BB56EB2|nr:patatin-like phospholipase family protein [Psychrobacter sp. FDAARGOS_221]PNK61858.1 patatin [Psychrobacter sp. FDAARGOS_221]